MTAPVQYSPAQAGRNVSRTVDALLRWHELLPAAVAPAVGMSEATLYRRLRKGDWHLDEVAALAVYFGIVDVSRLLAGQVLPANTRIADTADVERFCMNSVAMTFSAA